MADQWEPSGTTRILWEALKLPTKNWALTLAIILLTLLSYSLLFLSNYLSISSPLLTLFITLHVIRFAAPGTAQHATLAAAARKIVVDLAAVESLFIALSFLLSSLLLILTVKAAAAAYLKRHLTVKELITTVRRSWKGPMITQLYTAVLAFGCLLLLSAPIAFVGMVSDGSMTSITLAATISLVGLYFYLSLAAVWWLGAVVSVVEDGCAGAAAVERAAELIDGRRGQGAVITVVMMAVVGAIYGVYSTSTVVVAPMTANPLANGLVMVNMSGLWNAVIVVAQTLFYYECKKSRGEVEMKQIKGGHGYTRVASVAHVNQDLP